MMMKNHFNFWLPAASGGAALEANITLLLVLVLILVLVLLMSFTGNLLFCLSYHCLLLALIIISIALLI